MKEVEKAPQEMCIFQADKNTSLCTKLGGLESNQD